MTLAAIELVKWLASTFETSTDNVEQTLWLSLLAGLLAATIQFITMMVTRWGDSDPTRKAFMLSVVLHLSLVFGAVAVTPPERAAELVIPERTDIRQVTIENDEPVELTTAGNTRVWEQLPQNPDQLISRTERAPLELEPLAGPERTPDPVTMPDITLPDVRQVPDEPVARPEPQNSGEAAPLQESAAPLKITDTTAEARPDVNVPSMSAVRRPVEISGLTDTTLERQPTRGAVDQVAPQFDASRQLATVDVPTDPAAFLKRGPMEDSIRRRTGPAPSEVSDNQAGTAAATQTDDSATGSAGPPTFTRLRTRTPRMADVGGVQRFQPDATARTPNPIPSEVAGVRMGVASTFPRDGLTPNAVRPNFDPINPQATTSLPPTYRLRSLARRLDTARRFGGTDDSERAVETSLRWLALHQNPEGYWDADGYQAMCPDGDRCQGRGGDLAAVLNAADEQHKSLFETQAGSQADAGITGLAILAFLGAGYTHEEGQYADQIDRALSWLIRQQEPDGFLGGKATKYPRMYCHAIATYSMAEALGMQTDRSSDRRLREPLQRAIAYIVDAQNPSDGGWRYLKGQRGDMSMFGWQLMALKSADIAGLPMPESARKLMVRFLTDRSLGKDFGLASYRDLGPGFQPLPPSPSMTAEALFCKQMLGLSRTNPQSREAVGYLMERLPDRRSEDLYYWYYGTLAMYQYGGPEWRQWNTALRDWLVADQRTTGHAAGSWDPKPPWGPYGGRVFSTAVSTLCLEVYYRFLPLYQIGDDSLNAEGADGR